MGPKNELDYVTAKAVIEAVCRAEGMPVGISAQPRGSSVEVGRLCGKGFAVSVPANTQWTDLTRTLGILAFLWDLYELGDLNNTIECPLPSLQDDIQADITDACRRALEAYRTKASVI
jgi:hypothetical protein